MVACISSGGMETVIMNYYKNIDRSKIQFDFLVRLPESSSDFYNDEILKLGGRIYRIPYTSIWDKILYPIRIFLFLKRHKEYKIVHSHMDIMSVFYLFIAKLANIPVRISHSHNTSYDDNWKKYFKIILKPWISYVVTDKMSCGSEAAIWLYGDINNVLVLNNAIDTERFCFNPISRQTYRSLMGLDDKFVVGHVGHFMEQKNHDFLIRIFSEIRKLKENAVLLLVGSGGLETKIRDLVRKENIEDSVIFAGTTKEIEKYYLCMDIFVFPSFFEGMSVALIEAQCSGLRCFVSENVPREINITGLVTFISLKEQPRYWADSVLENISYNRKDMSDALDKKGFSIKSNSKILQNFYLDHSL